MEPLFVVVKFFALAMIGTVPSAPATVAGEVHVTSVSNTSTITKTIESDKKEAVVVHKQKQQEQKEQKAAQEKKEAEQKGPSVAEKVGLQLPLPAKSYGFTSDYGERCPPTSGASSKHGGIDLAAPNGTPIYAIADGTIMKVVDGVVGGQGGTVILATEINGERVDFFYHHMEKSSSFVKVGDQVKAGQQITAVGSTGVSTGPHLHIEVWEGGYGTGTRVDPKGYFSKVGLKVLENASYTALAKPTCVANVPAPLDVPVLPGAVSGKPATPAPSQQPASPAPSQPSAPRPSTPSPSPSQPSTPKPSPTPTKQPQPTPAPTEPVKPAPTAAPTQPAPSPSATSTASPSISVDVSVSLP
jgi:murein DD-endopeptidase MepM/ murein hydrolase activator NlpD